MVSTASSDASAVMASVTALMGVMRKTAVSVIQESISIVLSVAPQ